MAYCIFAVAAAAAVQASAPQASIQAAPAAMVAPAAPQATPTRPTEETLTNDTIIALVRAGLGHDTIVAKIGASRGSYDTSTNGLIALKQADVPDDVIAAMVNRAKSPVMANAMLDNSSADPMAPHSPGIYLLDPRGAGRMSRVDATVSNQTKTSNILGFAFSYGLSSMKIKTVLPNANARVTAVDRHPTFYFFFNQNSTLASLVDFSSGLTAAATSPSEFSLIKLERKKDHREAIVGSRGFASVKEGISDKARVAFTYSEIVPGIFKVTPSTELAPGEYGFLYSVNNSTSNARIFDFSVG
jgi:hypothetical protein